MQALIVIGVTFAALAMSGCVDAKQAASKDAGTKPVKPAERESSASEPASSETETASGDQDILKPIKSHKTKGVINDEGVVQVDSNGVFEDLGSAERGSVTVNVSRSRDDDVTLKVRYPGGNWVTQSLAGDGGTMTLAGLCTPKGKTTKLEIMVQHPEIGEVSEGPHMTVTGYGTSTISVAFDESDDGAPDDNIFTLSCGSGKIKKP